MSNNNYSIRRLARPFLASLGISVRHICQEALEVFIVIGWEWRVHSDVCDLLLKVSHLLLFLLSDEPSCVLSSDLIERTIWDMSSIDKAWLPSGTSCVEITHQTSWISTHIPATYRQTAFPLCVGEGEPWDGWTWNKSCDNPRSNIGRLVFPSIERC